MTANLQSSTMNSGTCVYHGCHHLKCKCSRTEYTLHMYVSSHMVQSLKQLQIPLLQSAMVSDTHTIQPAQESEIAVDSAVAVYYRVHSPFIPTDQVLN